ncbi:MAG: metallophosphoesterase, partial [Pseudomonadota bacterium]
MSERLFRIGIITDTHVRSPAGDQSSPYPVNDKANARAAYAARLLAEQQPDVVVHLGDMVHPLPHMSAYAPACEEALKLFAPLGESIHYVSGNHDTGDKPMPASPASGVDDAAIARYQQYFGRQYYKVQVENIALLVINS